ncbi:hypothetical protein Pfo_017942 [Paulownia fortunei]|nr:hypothetical protein Pfo_017942 [Paulownia fortunei]
MSINRVVIALFFTLSLAKTELSTGQVLKGSVKCLDCNKEMAPLRQLPMDNPKSPNSFNCMTQIMGGLTSSTLQPRILWSKLLKPMNEANFTISKSCHFKWKCVAKDMGFGSSKTVDLPRPREWGLAPTSYYMPFIPIIGIP